MRSTTVKEQGAMTTGWWRNFGIRLGMALAVLGLGIGLLAGPADAVSSTASGAAQSSQARQPSPPEQGRGEPPIDAGVRPHSPRTEARATGPGARSVLIVLVDWEATAGLATPAALRDGVTPAAAREQVEVTDTAWFQRQSYGQFAGWTATATGWHRIPTPPLDEGTKCVNGFRSTIQHEGNKAASASGLDPAAFHVVMYYFPRISCSWLGWANGNATWINGAMGTRTTVHELGHTLGLGHAHSDACHRDGTPVALSTTCTTDDYGDVYNVMGTGRTGSFSTIQKMDLGWMTGRHQDASKTSSGAFTIVPLEREQAGLQSVRVFDGPETFWLEYRQPVGDDAFLSSSSTSGVIVHRQRPEVWTPLGSHLLDMTPGSSMGFDDAPLPVGTSWTNPLGGVRITVLSADAAGARVEVRPTPPGTGTGLKGEYFDNTNFSPLKVVRTDATVDFDWGWSAPVPAMESDTFSVRWTGEVQPQHTDTYTFHATTDDGVRLWVNHQLLVDRWVDQGATESTGTIALAAGVRYPITIEYYDSGWWAVAQLHWSSATMPKQVIPATQLYSAPPLVSLRSVNFPTRFVRHWNYLGELTTMATDADRRDATFRVVPGLADPNAVSLESTALPGHYLRHEGFRIKLSRASSDTLFKQDATFHLVRGLSDGSKVSFQSLNYPSRYLRHRDFHLYIDEGSSWDGLFARDTTFEMINGLW